MLIYDNEIYLTPEEAASEIKDSFFLLPTDPLYINISHIGSKKELGYKLLLTDVVDPYGHILGMTKQVLVNTSDYVSELLTFLKKDVNVQVINSEENTEINMSKSLSN